MPPDEKEGAIAEETRGDLDDSQPQSQHLLECLFLSRKKMIDPFLHKVAGYGLGYRQFLLGLDLKLYFYFIFLSYSIYLGVEREAAVG